MIKRFALKTVMAGLALMLGTIACGFAEESARSRVTVGDKGRIMVAPAQPPGEWANAWPKRYWEEFHANRDASIRLAKGRSSDRTSGEQEKSAIPVTIGAFFAGDYVEALRALQTQDLQAASDHKHTNGIDLYWCFTLKGQAFKYFYFKQDLAEAYRAQFYTGAKLWTQSDPRPSLEYVLDLQDPDPEVRTFVLGELKKMWRPKNELLEMAKKAAAEGHPNKKRFADYIQANVDRIASEHPGDDYRKWELWWKGISDGDWMIFEEYERRVNPNPHPAYGIGQGPVGAEWDPNVRGMRADARNTDNLRGMRETAIYLFAEETENELIRKLYKSKLRRTAFSFYSHGNGEWDSVVYLGHTIAAYTNLFHFAKDAEVRGYAKAMLDYLYTSAAMKYWRGCWGGPVKRHYGNIGPLVGSAHTVHLFFGQHPAGPAATGHFELEQAFTMASGYIPPAAAVALAHKEFSKPLEVFSSHPAYSLWLPGAADAPEFKETMYYAHTYQYGTLPKGSGGDINGFNALLYNDKTGCDYFVPSSGAGKSPATGTAGGDNVAQYGPLCIFINGSANAQGDKGKIPFSFLISDTAERMQEQNILFLKFERTWLALHAINLAFEDTTTSYNDRAAQTPYAIFKATGTGGALNGFALEFGEVQTHGEFENFKKSVLEKSKLDLTNIDGGIVAYTGSQGPILRVGYQQAAGGLPQIWRDEKLHNWNVHLGVWENANGEKSPVRLRWKERILSIEAGGHTFRGEIKENGSYIFKDTISEHLE